MEFPYERTDGPTPEVLGNVFTGFMVEETAKSFDASSIYRFREFTEAMEYFDKDDDMTRNVLLSVNEADQVSVMTALSNKLYNHIVEKVDDIDFGSIPQSMGDITKIENYDKLVECINVITDILQHYNQPIENNIFVVKEALDNMVNRIELFTKAYKFNVEMPMIIYNTIALSIVSSVSLMISACIEFVKVPDDRGFDMSVDKAGLIKTKDMVLFKDLAKWNKLCVNGDFDKTMDYIINQTNNKNFVGSASIAFTASGVAVIIGLVLMIIPIIRELIFFFYYNKSRTSDYFAAQANILQMNAYNIENELSRDPKSRKEIAKKQNAVADTFKKISNFLKVEAKSAESKAAKEIKTVESKKYKQDEVLDSIPDSSNSVLF